MDIRKPDNTKKEKENSVTVLERFKVFSKKTKKQPTIKVAIAKNRYLNLKEYSEFIFLTRIGMLPRISPIKQ